MIYLERLLASWCLVLVGGCLLLIADLQFNLHTWFAKDTNAAAWVQAVGSVGAIIGSVGVFAWQRRLERKDRMLQIASSQLQAIEGARRLVNAGVNVCLKLAEALAAESGPVESRNLLTIATVCELRAVAAALHNVDSTQFEDWRVTEAVLASQGATNYLIEVLAVGMQSGPLGFEARQGALACCDATGTLLGDRLMRLAQACLDRGRSPL